MLTHSQLTRPRSLIAASMSVAALVSCGGGGSGGESRALTLSGTAATGLAMSQAEITAQCANGSQTGTADNKGAYTLNVPGGALPCVVQAKDANNTLYSLATGSGSEAVANVTPITHAVVAKVLGGEAAVAQALQAPSADRLKAAAEQLPTALTAVREALTGVADFSADPFTTAFVATHTGSDGTVYAGDAFDQQLDALQEKLGAANVSLGSFVAAIAEGSAGGASAPAVVGLLCPTLKSGSYVHFSQRGEMGLGTFNVDNRTWTSSSNANDVMTAEVNAGCELTLSENGSPRQRGVFNAQGVGLWRDASGVGSDFGIIMPVQKTNTLADLVGDWNVVGFDREDTVSTPAFGFSKSTVMADGSLTQSMCSTNAGTASCGAFESEPKFAVNNGKFSNEHAYGYLYKAPNGAKLYVQSFGDGNGLVVATPPETRTLPKVGDKLGSFWDVSGDFASSGDLISSPSALTVTAVDASTNSFTRSSDGQVRTINKPAEGMSYRAATEDSGAVIYMHAKGLLTVYGRENKDANSFVGFSIGK